jgi:hypothetical protein
MAPYITPLGRYGYYCVAPAGVVKEDTKEVLLWGHTRGAQWVLCPVQGPVLTHTGAQTADKSSSAGLQVPETEVHREFPQGGTAGVVLG